MERVRRLGPIGALILVVLIVDLAVLVVAAWALSGSCGERAKHELILCLEETDTSAVTVTAAIGLTLALLLVLRLRSTK